jgi:hypothetical protein
MAPPTRGWIIGGIALVIIVVLCFTTAGRAAVATFVASLRIERPQAVTVDLSAPAAAHYRLQDLVTGMLADTAVSADQPAQPVHSPGEAGNAVGFAVGVLASRVDTPTITIVGAHDVTVRYDAARLRTIVAEAGAPRSAAPASLDGTIVGLHTAPAVRLTYGHCPEAGPGTLASQVTGPPPLPPDVADCVILTETPVVTVRGAPGLDPAELVTIALETSGLSPDHAALIEQRLGWNGALALSLPRFVRSMDSLTVGDVPGLLLSTGGRRQPTYLAVWVRKDIVYTLQGFGSASNAAGLANAVH